MTTGPSNAPINPQGAPSQGPQSFDNLRRELHTVEAFVTNKASEVVTRVTRAETLAIGNNITEALLILQETDKTIQAMVSQIEAYQRAVQPSLGSISEDEKKQLAEDEIITEIGKLEDAQEQVMKTLVGKTVLYRTDNGDVAAEIVNTQYVINNNCSLTIHIIGRPDSETIEISIGDTTELAKVINIATLDRRPSTASGAKSKSGAKLQFEKDIDTITGRFPADLSLDLGQDTVSEGKQRTVYNTDTMQYETHLSFTMMKDIGTKSVVHTPRESMLVGANDLPLENDDIPKEHWSKDSRQFTLTTKAIGEDADQKFIILGIESVGGDINEAVLKELNATIKNKELTEDVAKGIVAIIRNIDQNTTTLEAAPKAALAAVAPVVEDKPKGWFANTWMGKWWTNRKKSNGGGNGNRGKKLKRAGGILGGLGLASLLFVGIAKLFGGSDGTFTATNDAGRDSAIAADASSDSGPDEITGRQRKADRELAEAEMDAGAAERAVRDLDMDAGTEARQAALATRQASQARLASARAAATPPSLIGTTPTVPTSVNTRPTAPNVVFPVATHNNTVGRRVIVAPTQNVPLQGASYIPAVGSSSVDVNGGTAAHPDRHNDSFERFAVHAANSILGTVQGLDGAQRTRAAGSLGHLIQHHADTFLAAHPRQARTFGQIHHGDHGNMTVEQVVRTGHGDTYRAFHIQLHRPGHNGPVLDLNVPVSEVESVLHAHGQHTPTPTPHIAHRVHSDSNTAQDPHVRSTTAHAPVAASTEHRTQAAGTTHSHGSQSPTVHSATRQRHGTQHPRIATPETIPAPVINPGPNGQQPDATGQSLPATTPQPAPEATPQTAQPAPAVVEQPQPIAQTVEVMGTQGLNYAQRLELSEAIRDFNLRMANDTDHPHTVGGKAFGRVVASISFGDRYDAQHRIDASNLRNPELDHQPLSITFQITDIPGATVGRHNSVEVSLPISVVRRSNGTMDIEVNTNNGNRTPHWTSALESNLRDTRVTCRRMVRTPLSDLTGNARYMARDEFDANDSNETIINGVTTAIAGFGVTADQPDRSLHLEHHNGQQEAGIYGVLRIGDNSPLANTLQYVLRQFVYVRLVPVIDLDEGHGRITRITEDTPDIRVLHPFDSPERDRIVQAFTAAIRAHLTPATFTNTPAPRVQPAPAPNSRPDTQPHPETDQDDIMPNLPASYGELMLDPNSAEHARRIAAIDADVARRRQVQRDVAISKDQATYDALIADLDQFYGHPSNNNNQRPSQSA